MMTRLAKSWDSQHAHDLCRMMVKCVVGKSHRLKSSQVRPFDCSSIVFSQNPLLLLSVIAIFVQLQRTVSRRLPRFTSREGHRSKAGSLHVHMRSCSNSFHVYSTQTIASKSGRFAACYPLEMEQNSGLSCALKLRIYKDPLIADGLRRRLRIRVFI